MATWGLHLRIAEALLERGYDLDEAMFAVGNIGPDCGMPNEDWSAFDPPTSVSHWKMEGDSKADIDADKFYRSHLAKELVDHKEKSFLVGYYVHLLTDIAFANYYRHRKKNDPLYAPLHSDPKFIWTIKEDWYDLDHLYFREHPKSLFYRVFQHVSEVDNYLDYYPEGAIIRQVRYITEFYQNPSDKLDREYIYLSMADMNQFVDKTLEGIIEDLEDRSLVRKIAVMKKVTADAAE